MLFGKSKTNKEARSHKRLSIKHVTFENASQSSTASSQSPSPEPYHPSRSSTNHRNGIVFALPENFSFAPDAHPLRCHPTDPDHDCRAEISVYISYRFPRLARTQREIVADRVYSSLALEGSPMLDFFKLTDKKGLGHVPVNMMLELDGAIEQQVRSLR
ncbi:hypothetical protein GGR57DRAFT_365671 [Xylariaceae sp. FL1272]|nr:hypothetical protein GGR57DRAFT_365671 [Xylariaceae sp. FL1272]